MSNASPHYTSLLEGPRHHDDQLGHLTSVTANELPILRNLSIRRLVLAPGALRSPHWHANADELTYCIRGTALVSVLDNADAFTSFTVAPGEMFHVQSGALHHIENIHSDEAEFIVALRHERPKDFGLGSAFGAMSDAVLGNTYDLDAAAFAGLERTTSEPAIVRRDGDPEIPTSAHYGDPSLFAVEAQSPPINSPAGSARLARASTWPVLRDISMYSLRITTQGMREPHWHPDTAEMGYVHEGTARMTIMNPDGSLDTWYLKPGDVYFIPRSYPHHIENTGQASFHFLIFFDQPTPADIGFRAAASAYSRETLRAMFPTSGENLPELPFTPLDPLIVGRINPVDQYAVGEHELAPLARQ